MAVRRLLAAEEFDAKFRGAQIVAQFSSMGSLSKNWVAEFCDSLSAGRQAGAGAAHSALSSYSVHNGQH